MIPFAESQTASSARRPLLALFAMCATVSLALDAAGQTPIDAGFRDFANTTGNSTPTGEKPECKLWFNDGFWWGSMWNDAALDYHIYRLNLGTQTWEDRGTVLDPRNSKADVLWDDATQKLYLSSHIFSLNPVPLASNWGRLFRYSYDTSTDAYALDTGFPVDITRGNAEALTIAKDSTGRLWATWAQRVTAPDGAPTVWVNHSGADDLTWGLPFVLPVNSAALGIEIDDISAILAFGGSKVGIMWSNQATDTTYFAVHNDSDAADVWSLETVVPGSGCTGACADDLMSLKTDSTGRVFASIKTSLGDGLSPDPTAPLVMLAVREAAGGWTGHKFGRVQDHHTRPILLLDEPNQELYIFASHPEAGGAIYYKKSSMNVVEFPEGLGTPFIQSSAANETTINNATSTKQNVTSASGIVVLASEQNVNARFYFHNYLALAAPPEGPEISSFDPTSGTADTPVIIAGSNFTGSTGVAFNGTPVTAFIVDSDVQISTAVPAGATTGKISVTAPVGTGTSIDDFTVIAETPSIDSFLPTSGGVGTPVVIAGSNFTGVTAVAFNGVAATFIVDSDSQITATVPSGASTGKISATTPGGTGTSSDDFTVIVELPSIDSFLPTSGGVGTVVDITGSNFTGASAVAFNGVAALFIVNSGTEITANVPSGATTGKISVTTPGGTAQSPGDFTVIPAPIITSFSPTRGIEGTVVTILGSHFTGATAVAFHGESADFTVDSDTQITATVPDASTGKIAVTTPGGTAESAAKFEVIKLPQIKSFSPDSGRVGTKVTIHGKNFQGATQVTFNGVSSSFTVKNNSQIKATVPPGATTGKIGVTNPAGTAFSKKNFQVQP